MKTTLRNKVLFKYGICLFLMQLLLAAKLSASIIPVNSLPALQTAINNAVPGDVIVLANGVYTSTADITINKKGTAGQPITITAESIGGAEINGAGGISIASPAAYIIIKGFKFTHKAGRAKTAAGTTFCQWTHNIFETPGDGENLNIAGSDHQVDYNTFQHKNAMGRFLAIRGSGSQIAQRLWIHHNYFFDHKRQSANGAESFQFGLSGYSMSSSNSIVEHNLFEQCDGENELISIKSSAVTLRYNTIRDCPGQFTLRHGNHCPVYGNYFINTPGIRIFGDDHTIFSNHFENCSPAINIGNGDGEVADGAPLTCHDRPDRVLIAFNTLVNNPQNITQAGRTNGLGSTFITIAYNVIQGGNAAVSTAGIYTDPAYAGNILFNTAGPGKIPADAYTIVDPLLARDLTGTFHLQSGSPAIGVATTGYPSITFDMDGQSRSLPLDAGADQVSASPVTARILNATAVGHNAGASEVPVAGITFPLNNSIVEAGTIIPVTASAISFNDSLTRVDFFLDGIKFGEAAAKPYTINWQAVEGVHLLAVKAFDNEGKESLLSRITITVNPAGARVRIASPTNGTTYIEPADIAIEATATDSIGTVVKVAFYNGSILLGTDSVSPYSFQWTNVPDGKYVLQARSTNNEGKISVSVPVNITVNNAVSSSFDITDNGGIISGQYPNTSKPTENFPSLIDNIKTTKYFRSGRTALWVQYQSVVPAIIVKYTLTSANDVVGRDPRDWALQGSNNGSSWNTLDTRAGELFATRGLLRSFTFTNTTPYLYYRLNITANNGETGIQFAEWELYERRVQVITVDSIGEKTYGDAPFDLIAATNGGLPVSFELVSGPATLVDSVLTITGAGTIVVKAAQAGNEQYFPADTTVSILVQKAQQSLVFEEINGKTYGDSAFPLRASVESGLPVSFALLAGPAILMNDSLFITGTGDVTVKAIQEGNADYVADSITQSFTVSKALQTITFPVISPKLKYETVTLNATASTGLPVTYSIAPGAGIITGNKLKLTTEGLVTVTATQSGNDNYEAASGDLSILVLGIGLIKDPIDIRVYPNPTTGPVKVKLNNKLDRTYRFQVYNKQGYLVASAVIQQGQAVNEVSFNLAALNDDLYFLHVTDGQDKTVRIIIKY